MSQIIFTLRLPCSVERLWAFHELPDVLDRLNPPGSGVQVVERKGGLEVGSTVALSMPLLPGLRCRWLARHTAYQPGVRFVDVQAEGPFASWQHEHLFRACTASEGGGAELVDRITYRMRWWQLPGALLLRPKLRAIFAHRHAVTRAWCCGDTAA